MAKDTDKYIVTLCSYHKNSIFEWFPKVKISKISGSDNVEFERIWTNTFLTPSQADNYALKGAKEWVAKDSGAKTVFTRFEWFIHVLTVVIIVIFSVLFVGIIALVKLFGP